MFAKVLSTLLKAIINWVILPKMNLKLFFTFKLIQTCTAKQLSSINFDHFKHFQLQVMPILIVLYYHISVILTVPLTQFTTSFIGQYRFKMWPFVINFQCRLFKFNLDFFLKLLFQCNIGVSSLLLEFSTFYQLFQAIAANVFRKTIVCENLKLAEKTD